ncbi:MAG: hypothetical protein AAB511_02985 [Patescibacteria group bacterium]
MEQEIIKNVKEPLSRSHLSDTIIVTFLTAFSYFVAFLYHLGYLSVFNVPIQFVTVTLTDIFIAVLAVLGTFFSLANIINVFMPLIPFEKKDHPVFIASASISIWLFIAMIIIYLFHDFLSLAYWLGIFGVICFFGAIEFLLPMFNRKGKTYIENMTSQQQLSTKSTTVIGLLLPSESINFKLLFFVVFATFLAFTCGISNALRQKQFLVFKNPTSISIDMAVVGVFDGKILAVSFEPDTKKLTHQLQIFDTSTLNLPFVNKSVGPLKSQNSEVVTVIATVNPINVQGNK